jgi:hypothetical protein
MCVAVRAIMHLLIPTVNPLCSGRLIPALNHQLHSWLSALQRDIISLESVAANEATFRVPDQDGWQPCNTPITDVPSPCCVLRPVQPAPAATATSGSHQQREGAAGQKFAAAAAAGRTPGFATSGTLGAGSEVLPGMGGDLGSAACSQQLTTDLPLQHMQQVLANAGYQCQVSSDAGR